MTNDLENRLRSALRPVDPDDGFADRIMQRIETERPRRWQPARRHWLPATLAASVVLGLVIIHGWQTQRERQGLEARRQLIEALRVTGEKLDLAYRGVNGEMQSAGPPDAGA